MSSFRSRVFRCMLKNRHLLKGHLKKEVITTETSLERLREDVRISAAKMTKMPEGIEIRPADFPRLYAEWVIPKDAKEEQVILYYHGSGFVMGTSRDHRGLVAKFCERCKVKALTFDYRLAPEHPFPAAVEDGLAIYQWLLEKGYKPENIIVAGDSAGGCIALSDLLLLRDENIPLTCAAVLFSPCTDLMMTGKSHITKAKADPATPKGASETYMNYYIGEGDPRNPYMSPLFADLAGLPPMMIQVGEDETLLDDSIRFAEKAETAGVKVRLHVWEGMFHCFPLLAPMFPEATAAMEEVCGFIKEYIGRK
jgi:monoterpene epsilon-lactone hydrolase